MMLATSSDWTMPLFSHPGEDVLSAVLALLCVIFASAGSIGGGGLLVPLFVLISHLGRNAIPLSKATIMGGAIMNAFLRWSARHPTVDRPLIAFDVAVMFEPPTLVGTVIGVTLNTLCPQWLVTVCLVALLGFTARKTLVKALATWAKENEQSLEKAKAAAPPLMRTLSASATLSSRDADEAVAITEVESFEGAKDEGSAKGEGSARKKKEDALTPLREALLPSTAGGTAAGAPPAAASSSSSASSSTLPSATHWWHPYRLLSAEGLGLWTSPAPSELGAILERERTAQPWLLLSLAGAWLVMLASVLLRGGHGAPPVLMPVACGSALYWALPVGASTALLSLTHLAGRRLAAEHAAKLAAKYTFADGDARCTPIAEARTLTLPNAGCATVASKHTRASRTQPAQSLSCALTASVSARLVAAGEGRNLSTLPFVCTLAGVAAGGLGVGGAMVKGPLMLEMGMQPAVSSATATFMILFTSSLTTIQFLIAGLLRWDYTVFYAGVGALGTLVGQKSVGHLVKMSGRQSVLALALGINIAVSAVVMGLVGMWQVFSDAASGNWAAFEFQPLCK